jgi:Tol biopolymer transport system component
MAWIWTKRTPAEAGSTVRFILAADTTGVVPGQEFAFSPDGRTIVFKGTAGADTVDRLYVRPLDAVVARPLAGTEHARQPVFSPDGQWVAFWNDGDVRKVRLDGQQLTTLARVGDIWGGMSWGVQNSIVVAHAGQLWAVSEAGGTPTRIVARDTVSLSRLFPLALSDGKTVVYTEWHSSITTSTLNLLSLESGEVTRLGVAGSSPLAVIENRLAYLDANGNLATIGFDPRSRRTSGEPTVVIPDVRNSAGQGEAAVSGRGDLVYVSGRIQTHLVVANADGERTLIARPNAGPQFPRWSPDGRLIAFRSRLSGSSEIWIYSVETKSFAQLTRTREGAVYSEWAPDGQHLLFTADGGLWSQPVGGGAATNIMNAGGVIGFSVSPDGRTIVFRTGTEEGRKLWYRSLGGDTTTHLLDAGPGALEPSFSPDGKWIAYTSGDLAVYIARFPDLSDRQRISLEVGRDPVWSRDMRRLYYSAGGGTVMAADLSAGPKPTVTRRVKVLSGPYQLGRGHPGFDVSRDGSIVIAREQRENARTIVVQGWVHELRALAKKSGTGGIP